MDSMEIAPEPEEDFMQMQGEDQKDEDVDWEGMDKRHKRKVLLYYTIYPACLFACTQIFTLVYGLYHFDVIGATKTDCYYVKGNKLPLSAISASVTAKALGNGVKPINVSTNFDYLITLGLWNSLFTWALPLFILKDKCCCRIRMKRNTSEIIQLMIVLIMVVLQLTSFISAIIYRHSEAGAVCAGSYLSKPNPAQSAIIMTSKGLFINIILIMNYVFIGFVSCYSCVQISKMIMKKQRQKKEREMEEQPRTEMEINDTQMNYDKPDEAGMDDGVPDDARME